MVACAAIPALPPLSDRDADLLAQLLRCSFDLFTLGREAGLAPAELVRWAASPAVAAYLSSLRASSDAATHLRHAQARHAALETLEAITRTAEDPVERRRAASLIVRFPSALGRTRPHPGPSRPEEGGRAPFRSIDPSPDPGIHPACAPAPPPKPDAPAELAPAGLPPPADPPPPRDRSTQPADGDSAPESSRSARAADPIDEAGTPATVPADAAPAPPPSLSPALPPMRSPHDAAAAMRADDRHDPLPARGHRAPPALLASCSRPRFIPPPPAPEDDRLLRRFRNALLYGPPPTPRTGGEQSGIALGTLPAAPSPDHDPAALVQALYCDLASPSTVALNRLHAHMSPSARLLGEPVHPDAAGFAAAIKRSALRQIGSTDPPTGVPLQRSHSRAAFHIHMIYFPTGHRIDLLVELCRADADPHRGCWLFENIELVGRPPPDP